MNLPGMNEVLADGILDWIDQDDEPREFGAESEFYLGLDPPRQPPNQVPARIEDLLAVRGMNAWQLLGQPTGRFSIATSEAQASSRPEREATSLTTEVDAATTWLTPGPPWMHLLTVSSAERNEDFAGHPRIDLNQADLTALAVGADRVLGSGTHSIRPRLPTIWSVDGRHRNGIRRTRFPPAHLVVPRASGWPRRWIWSMPSSNCPMPMITKGKKRRPMPARLIGKQPSSLSKLVEFCDRTTTEPAAILEGRVNIQTASRPVLLGIPRLMPDQVDQILSARDTQQDAALTREHRGLATGRGTRGSGNDEAGSGRSSRSAATSFRRRSSPSTTLNPLGLARKSWLTVQANPRRQYITGTCGDRASASAGRT